MDKAVDLNKFIELMDSEPDKKYYVRLGEWLIEKKKMKGNLKEVLKGLENHKYGGGSSTLAFLEANEVKRPNDLVKKLRDEAKSLKREDLINALRGIDDNKKMEDLTLDERDKLAKCLDKTGRGLKEGWEEITSAFGYNNDERNVFRNSRIIPGSFSPTKGLMTALKHRNENLSLELIIHWAKSIPRDDVSKMLEKFIAKINPRNTLSPMQVADSIDNIVELANIINKPQQ